ncbi:cartilage intermediate layer protein 1-like [Dendronephthya gigantea]|uniref:cartilage intermediate layer protein 1-like n=1 Tax=Dendronephthya gigantea TaxID=151771 RepID=UPI00106BE0D8|nr:cartilage intermediate layer protein 1-like [Dendronephthya gigantea]
MPHIQSAKNGQVLGGGSLEGDELSFVCNKHYVLVGEKALRCKSSGKWNASEPKCKDCNKICTTGKLDTTCDACICDDNTLTGVVKDNTGILLENATIALAEFPFKVSGSTGVSGKFVLQGFCISEDNIIVSRKGYLPQTIRTTKVSPTAAVVTAILRKIVFPEITSHPESKLRLEGQPMTLCCEGKSSTKAKFEWTINDRGADEYQHDEIQSNTTDDSCDPTPSQHIIALPQGCTAGETNSVTIDVGDCAKTKCIARGLKNMNYCKDKFCCQPIATRNIKVVCSQHSFDMKSVTKCGCGDCPVKQTVVKGVARGGPDNKPFKYGYIYHGDKYLARTGRKGDFSFKVPGDFSRFAVTFKDKRNYNNFQELTKVIPLVTGRETYIEVRLKPRPEPIKVDAKMGFEISLGNSQNTRGLNKSNEENVVDNDDAQLEPAVAFAVPPQGLLTEHGEIYNGTVKVEVNFVDPRNVTEVEEADGDFTTVDEDGEEQQLETFGVIKMDFKDENDKSLQPTGDIDISLDIDKYNITENEVENIKLWYLDEKTGRWRILDTSWKKHQTKRSKRSDKHISLFTTKLNAREFIRFDLNLDKVGGEIYLKVMAEDTTKKAESVLITVFVTQSRVNYRYRSYNIEPNKAHCIKTFRTDEFAKIRAVVGDQYPLTPKETGLDEDVIKKHLIKIISEGSHGYFTMQTLNRPLSNRPSPFYEDEASCLEGPEEYSFLFEMPVREELKKIEDVRQIDDEDWYTENNKGVVVCYVQIAVENINECPNKMAAFKVEKLKSVFDTYLPKRTIKIHQSDRPDDKQT